LKKEFAYNQPLISEGIISEKHNNFFSLRSNMMNELQQYKKEMGIELGKILSWWMKMVLDENCGGFVGKIDHDNKIYSEAPKGSVLNSRILWAFSAAYNQTGNKKYLKIAERSFNYILEYFIDKEYGGVYWTVDFKGNSLDTKKQIYALAFAIYGLSEYYLASKNERAKQKAIEIYNDVVSHSYDEKYGGYIEALTRDWNEIGDQRLSSKDANEKKSMNTHLHLLEAFANLYKTWKDELLRKRVIELIQIFLDHIIDKETHHLILFFNEEWKSKSGIISYGHDIEAAWLIQEATEIIKEEFLLGQIKNISVKIAAAAAKGLDEDGGLWYEYDVSQHHLVNEKHWWPQAEAMVGFFNAWQITGKESFLNHSLCSWQFVKDHMTDTQLGEWYWGVNEDYSSIKQKEKVGIWKCPYHNSRACMEIIKRINGL
jgi:mannobiose 2-epimerase